MLTADHAARRGEVAALVEENRKIINNVK